MSAAIDEYVRRWNLEPDGEPIVTPRAELLPVMRAGQAAMLKIVNRQSERRATAVLKWWAGSGGVQVLESDGAAVLLERSAEPGRLLALYQEGRDEEAIGIIANVAARLHAPRNAQPTDDLIPLATWFADLSAAAGRLGGVLHASADAAASLLASQTEAMVLHGDLHHENVLFFGERGWLAIDPKGVLGERLFEFVPQLLDPDDGGEPDLPRLERQLAITAAVAGLEPDRLRRWLLAWAGLLAVWWHEDGKSAEPSLRVAAAMAAKSR